MEDTETASWWLASLSSSRLLLFSDVLDWCLTLRSLGVEGGLPGGSWLWTLDGLEAPARMSVIMNLDLCGMVVEASPKTLSRLLLLFLESKPFDNLSILLPFLSTMFSSRWAPRLDILLRLRPLLATAIPLIAATWWFWRWWWTVITDDDESGLRAPAGASVATPGLTRNLGERILPTVTIGIMVFNQCFYSLYTIYDSDHSILSTQMLPLSHTKWWSSESWCKTCWEIWKLSRKERHPENKNFNKRNKSSATRR